jgi:SOS-response transcriptional repressor LexA
MENHLEIAARLAKLIDARYPGRGGRNRAAEAMGVQPAFLSTVLTAKRRPELATYRRFADFLKVPVEQVLGITSPKKSPQLTSHPIDSTDYRLIPDWGVVSAGPPCDPGDPAMVPVIDLPAEGSFVSFVVRGRSMSRTIPDGARIIVRIQPGARSGETVVAYIDDGKGGGGLVLKKAVWNDEEERMELHSLEAGKRPKAIPFDQAHIVGVLKSYTVHVAT